MATGRLGPLLLCPQCYTRFYLPLAAPADVARDRVHGMPLIEPDVTGEEAS